MFTQLVTARRPPTKNKPATPRRIMIDPLISLQLRHQGRIYHPGDELECECQIDAVEADEIQAIEASVLWYTEGKGDEDLAVHFFERRTPSDAEDGDLRPLHRFRTILPNSPLSYSGSMVKIRWCARVRLFLRRGKELFFEQPFVLAAHSAELAVSN